MESNNEITRINRRHFLSRAGTCLAGATTAAWASSQEARDPRAPQKRFRIVDTHLHTFNSKLQGTHGIPYYDPDSTIEYELIVWNAVGPLQLGVERMKMRGTHGIPYYDPDSTIEYELSLMDRGGVDKAFLI